MTDREFGRLCGTLILLALEGDAADMEQMRAFISDLVERRKLEHD